MKPREITRNIEELLTVAKNKDDLNMKEAIVYLNFIGVKISMKTLYCWISAGKGPRVYKRNSKSYFTIHDLDALKKEKTTIKEAYSRAA
jgi:predicted site-specific integrase-resolvase